MHAAAYDYVANCAKLIGRRESVLELGSLNVNGSVRPLFPSAKTYLGIDVRPGPEVDIVADASNWRPADGKLFDLVISTECLEHAPRPEAICQTAFDVLALGGAFILTAAGPGRSPHGVDGEHVGSEYYENIEPDLLAYWLNPFVTVLIDQIPGDVRALAFKSKPVLKLAPRIPTRCVHIGPIVRREGCSCEAKFIRQCGVHGEITIQKCYKCPDYRASRIG